MISKRCALELDAFENPLFSSRQESWEDFIQFRPQRLYNPDSVYSEMLFEKPQEEFREKMEEEDNLSMGEETALRTFIDEFDLAQALQKRQDSIRFQNEHNSGAPAMENELETCSQCHSEEEEEVGSISTRESIFARFNNIDSDGMSFTLDDTMSLDQSFEFETGLKTKAWEFMQTRPQEEREYIKKVMPLLVSSAREIYKKNQLPLTDDIIVSIIKNLLEGKRTLLGEERQVLRKLVGNEMSELRDQRPNAKATEDDLMMQKRKEKKMVKGNKNSSNLNHLNENYVSNIFQFAKKNYPTDKEIQKLGNERNVSASNFRNLMTTKLSDDLMTRKAKARITGSGSELVANVEYWMREGYFGQCAEREKYIWHKEKALRDLALTGQY